ncbi:DPP IV N-terminal domain-containing protein [Pontiella sp.]|uniref:DPP IV N-terminal domain-containing protein n=1 Tax=Pontiella sp. TaxID=2837462 RepID=UPI0035661DC8
MKQIFPFFVALSIAAEAWCAIDYEVANSLRGRVSNTVKNAQLLPVWAPDASALYIQRGSGIVRVDTATGQEEDAIAPGILETLFPGEEPFIRNFGFDADGRTVFLVTAGKQVRTLRVKGTVIETVAPADDPFALPARKATPKSRSGNGKGSTKLYFVNNTDEPHEIAWISAAGERVVYTTLKPGESSSQNTHAGHLFTAGKLAFTARKQPGVAYLGAEPAAPQGRKPKAEEDTASNGWKAEFKEFNLYVKNRQTDQTTQLTTDGTENFKYCGPLEWSPDGRYVVAMREKAGTNRHIDLIEAAPKDQLQPKTRSVYYLKPGDELNVAKPHLFDLETGKEIAIDGGLFPNPWSISRLHWTPDGKRLFLLYNERGHQTLRLIEVEAATGKTRSVIEETSSTFVDYSRKTFLQQLDETDEAIWMSERSGWNHLYLVDRGTGKIQPITSGEWVVREVEHVDVEKRQIWFRALGIHPGQDPYLTHFARINFDGTGLTLLTEGNGTHAIAFSKDRKFYTDTWSRVDLPPVHELRRSSDGQKVADLGKADATELWAVHPHQPEPFAAAGRDGKTSIHGVIFRPSNFDPTKRYPILEAIYAGPHDFFVPKQFSAYHHAQLLAELGYIVVQIDGMGTNWRSKSFHDVCWKNIKDAGFPDRIAWIQAAAAKYPYMDVSRVGIYGGSAGGQNAMRAVLDHADFYKAASADCGCHDNRMDKIWWNEAWMGWPVDKSYEESSNAVDAHKLGGKLLLMVGLLDANVDPSSTMQVAEALIQAGKPFEIMVFPSGGHCPGDVEFGKRRLAEFFIRHLGTCDVAPMPEILQPK